MKSTLRALVRRRWPAQRATLLSRCVVGVGGRCEYGDLERACVASLACSTCHLIVEVCGGCGGKVRV
eukprot:145573-Chlamydomonas_euryale.AAC.8